MAEKRMFTMKIVDSDAFLDMPLSTQALYFHLNMRADDDGFVNNPKKIQRVIGASDDDLKLLIAKRFILAFESGVIVIKHWRMHNLLRKDRYNPTQYQEEYSRLETKKNGSYTELATTWQPNGNQLATQDSIGKDSIGKDSKYIMSSAEDDKKKERKETTKKVIEYLNEKTGKHYKPVDSNLKIINARLDEGYTYEDFVKVIDVKYSEWMNTDYEKFIRPATLFAKSHFDNYLNQKEEVKRGAEFFGY